MSTMSLDSLKQSLPTTRPPCDYTLVVGDVKFPVHKSVLIDCSDFFRAMLNSEMTEKYEEVFKMDDFDVETIRSIIDFAYSGRININDENIFSILEAVSFLQLKNVNSIQAGITVNNCIDIMHVTDLHNITDYSKEIKTFIANNFSSIAPTEISRLTFEELLSIVEDDNLKVESELEIVNKVKYWMEMNKAINFEEVSPVTKSDEEPWIQFIKLLSNIRWCLISMGVLATELNRGIKNAMDLIPECKSYLTEAEDYHRFVYKQPLQLNVRAQPRRFKSVIATLNEYRRSVDFTDLSTNDKFRGTRVSKNTSMIKMVNVNNYIFTIQYGIKSSVLYRYDPRQNEWLELKELPLHDTRIVLLAYGDNLFLIVNRCYVYNIAENHFSEIANMPYVHSAGGCVANGAIYIIRGFRDLDLNPKLCRFNIDENTWMELARLNTKRVGHTMSNIGQFLYVIGGDRLGPISDTEDGKVIERYCISTNQWTLCKQELKIAFYRCDSYNIDGQIYIVGGLISHGESNNYTMTNNTKVYVFSEDKEEVEELPGIDIERN